MWPKINSFIGHYKEELYLVLIIILVALLAFGLGRLSVIYEERGEFKILYPENQAAAVIVGSTQVAVGSSDSKPQSAPYNLPPPPIGGGEYVASRTGTTYYFPWCGNANRIKKENRVYFKTREAVEAAGYRPGNCSGLTK